MGVYTFRFTRKVDCGRVLRIGNDYGEGQARPSETDGLSCIQYNDHNLERTMYGTTGLRAMLIGVCVATALGVVPLARTRSPN